MENPVDDIFRATVDLLRATGHTVYVIVGWALGNVFNVFLFLVVCWVAGRLIGTVISFVVDLMGAPILEDRDECRQFADDTDLELPHTEEVQRRRRELPPGMAPEVYISRGYQRILDGNIAAEAEAQARMAWSIEMGVSLEEIEELERLDPWRRWW